MSLVWMTRHGIERISCSKVILFVDELNKFAPTGGRRRTRRFSLISVEIAERGRSLGIILLSAQQFSSAVHTRE